MVNLFRISVFGIRIYFFVTCIAFLAGQPAHAGCLSFDDVVANGTYAVSDRQGNVLGSCNIDIPFIPASILKIPTAFAALQVVGADYRFTTEFYTDSNHNLYIRGFGDPQLISEEVLVILEVLYAKGLRTVHDIFIDDSAFALEHQPFGRGTSNKPYDAPIGATVVNFNSVAIRVDNSRPQPESRIRSAEAETPTMPIMKELGQGWKSGKYLINNCPGPCRPEARMARFTAELFRAQMKKVGIRGTGSYGRKLVPPHARLLYRHENSKKLDEFLSLMLKYSSNFIANLVYLTIGAAQYGYPATWEKADLAVHNTLVELLGEKTASLIVQVEGSGLSRKNTMTARAMLKILQQFAPHAHLLRKRRGVLAKTGTMKGIYNYAGYLKDGNPFVIMLNQKANTRSTVLDRLKLRRYRKQR